MNTQQTATAKPPFLRRPLVRASALFFSLAVLAVLFHLLDIQNILEPAWADRHLKESAETALWQGMLIYIAVTAVLSPVGVPRQALSALGGYAFGALVGSVLASIGLTIGCACGFYYARLLGRGALQHRFGRRLQRLETFLARSPFAMTVAVRCFPLGSNALTNLAAGLTGIPALSFIAGSALGYLPQTIIFTLLGSGMRVDPFWRILTATLLFIAASAIGFMLYKRFSGELGGADAEPSGQPSDGEPGTGTKASGT